MDTSLFNNSLPKEIAYTIYQHLTETNDIRSCLLVCQLWNYLVTGLFGDRIQVKLSSNNCHAFLKDVKRYPSLGSKVWRIAFDNRSLSTIAVRRTETLVTLQSAINSCPNLVRFRLLSNDNLEAYLSVLQHVNTRMPSIQKISIAYLSGVTPCIKQMHLYVNLKYCRTVESMSILDVGKNETLDKLGGLVTCISKFPNLRQCYLSGSIASTFNLDSMQKMNPNLEYLEICGGKLTVESDYRARGVPKNDAIKSMELYVYSIDIKCLQYIMEQLQGLENLTIKCTNDIICDTSTEPSDFRYIFERFIFYCKQLRNGYLVNLKYNNFEFKLTQPGIKMVTDEDDESNLDYYFEDYNYYLSDDLDSWWYPGYTI
ncbi:hypothetical protein BDF21DRAFT_465519 [Thamnidium elegans]|uniref:F-box domain-containing protein n=1 Tax=Thamnidium elegans TaxID=101142 RepID=A0A8H7W2P3_9FUNG|nr:hypothetical protein INT48_001398 [Thamnidium elegans]KAI8070090.1 hypothetical protein BDF21DRAFT_465519 [Thamnidium elegans]